MPEHEGNLLNTGRPMTIINASTENTISIIQNGNVGTAVATDGAIHINNTNNTGIGFAVYSDIDSAMAAPLVYFKTDNAAADQAVCKMETDGNNNVLVLYGNKTDGTSQAVLVITDVNTVAGNQTFKVISSRGTATQAVLIDMNGNGAGLTIDHDDVGAGVSLDIDRDGNNAGRIFGIKITVDNTGSGNLVGGIDFSGMSDGEPIFKIATEDTDLSSKSPETDAEAGFFPILVGTTIYAVPIYALS